MKHDYIKKQMQNHLSKGIHDALTGTQPPVLKLTRAANDRYTPDRVRNPVRGAEGKTGGFLPKGPPGRSRSPGVGKELFPDHPPDEIFTPDRVQNSVGAEIEPKPSLKIRRLTELKINTEYQNMNKNQNLNFLQTLNFTNMKKQILFLAFFVLVALASITESYGQMPLSTIGTESATCSGTGNDSPLNPKPGKAYDYGVTIGNTGDLTEPVTNYFWWATKNPVFVDGTSTPVVSPNTANMLDTSNGLIATGAGYAQATGGTQTMSITWSPSILALTEYQGLGVPPAKSPTFVAVMAQGSCSNNIQVFEIDPVPAFTVDITNFDATKTIAENYGNTVSTCVSPVVSAVYNSTSKEVDMDYGKNTIYFEVISANFVGSWTPTVTVTGLDGAETASATIHYSYADAIAGTNVVGNTLNFPTDGSDDVGTTALGSTVSDTSGGVSFWLAVTVDHNNYESLVERPITVAVGGMDTTGQFDLANNCDDVTALDLDDSATQGITPRPQIDDATNDAAQNPSAPNTFIDKNVP